MLPSKFPLRWESTGDHWWYASPIDYAAANGHYDTVRELLRVDANQLISLTSLRRIRRLETVWDDEHRFQAIAQCRANVAKHLFLECQNNNIKARNSNSLLTAGYGGWLLYTVASAGDFELVKELLAINSSLVFGDGEYGVTDIFYAAARSGDADIFWFVYDLAKSRDEVPVVYKMEIMNRAIHAAARGGNVLVLKRLLRNCRNVLAFRDRNGATVLHSAAARGRDEVVDELLSSFDIGLSKDCQGNTALHVAAYRGHLLVVETLISTCRSLIFCENNAGDNFLHMAVAGVGAKTFRRLDRQMDLIESVMNLGNVINGKNRDGRTPLHMAVIREVRIEVVQLLMSAPFVDVNSRDKDGMTPLDLLRRRKKRCADKGGLMGKTISAGGGFNFRDLVWRLKMEDRGGSPGAHFQIPDGEFFLYSGIEDASESRYDSSPPSGEEDELSGENNWKTPRKLGLNSAAQRLKIILPWSRSKCSEIVDPVPLRQRFPKSMPAISKQASPIAFSNHVSPIAMMCAPRSIASSPCVKETIGRNDGKASEPRINAKKKHSSKHGRSSSQYLCFGSSAHSSAIRHNRNHSVC